MTITFTSTPTLRSHNLPQPAFGHILALDIGASDRKTGTVKGRLFHNDGQELHSSKDIISKDGFFGPVSFINGLQAFIEKLLNSKKIENLPPEVDHIVAVIPGPVDDTHKRVPVLINLQTTEGKVLENIEFSNLMSHFPNAKLTLTNDTLGAAAYFAHQLVSNPQYKERFEDAGTYFFVASTGSGLGVADVTHGHKESGLLIKATEASHALYDGSTFENAALSTLALVKNFYKALKMLGYSPKALEPVRTAPRTSIVTSYDEAQKVIQNLKPEDYETAAVTAVDKYLTAMATLIQHRVVNNAHLGILHGTVDRGVSKFLEEHPYLFMEDLDRYRKTPVIQRPNKNVLEKILLSRIYCGNMSSDQTVTQKMMAKNKFDIITNIPLSDNTKGGWHLAQGNYTGKNSPWYRIPLDKLKQSPG